MLIPPVTFIHRWLCYALTLILLLSCQPSPVLNTVSDNNFRIQDYTTGSSGSVTSSGVSEFSANLNFAGAKFHPGSSQWNLGSPFHSIPRYWFTIDKYHLDKETGKQYPEKAGFAFTGSIDTINGERRSTANLSFDVTELVAEDPASPVLIVRAGSGSGSFSFMQPDGVFHGNMGYNCREVEGGSFRFNITGGTIRLSEDGHTFDADLVFSPKDGISHSTLSPWQCMYVCGPNDPNYNSSCPHNISFSGSFKLKGQARYLSPSNPIVTPLTPIISPANQDGYKDGSIITIRPILESQLWVGRVLNTDVEITNEDQYFYSPRMQWNGKNGGEFVPDGTYTIEVKTDGKVGTGEIQVDNTAPTVSAPVVRMRNGQRAVEVTVTDPEVNGVRSGIDRYDLDAYIESDRPGSWKVSRVSLDNHSVLISAAYFASGNSSGESNDTFKVRARDRVYNLTESQQPFDINEEPEPEESSSPKPEEECEDESLLSPQAIQPLVTDAMEPYPVESGHLNDYEHWFQVVERREQALQEAGVSAPPDSPLPYPGPYQPPSASSNNVNSGEANAPSTANNENTWTVASSWSASGSPSSGWDPSAYPSGNPGNLTARQQRLWDQYSAARYERDSKRSQLLSQIQNHEQGLQQATLARTPYGFHGLDLTGADRPYGIEDYKQLLSNIYTQIDDRLYKPNTYKLIDVANNLTELQRIHNLLLQDYISERLGTIQPSGNSYSTERLEEITTPKQLVSYNNRRTLQYWNRLNMAYVKLSSEADRLDQEMAIAYHQGQTLLHEMTFAILVEEGFIHPDTLRLSDPNNPGFSIQANNSRNVEWAKTKAEAAYGSIPEFVKNFLKERHPLGPAFELRQHMNEVLAQRIKGMSKAGWNALKSTNPNEAAKIIDNIVSAATSAYDSGVLNPGSYLTDPFELKAKATQKLLDTLDGAQKELNGLKKRYPNNPGLQKNLNKTSNDIRSLQKKIDEKCGACDSEAEKNAEREREGDACDKGGNALDCDAAKARKNRYVSYDEICQAANSCHKYPQFLGHSVFFDDKGIPDFSKAQKNGQSITQLPNGDKIVYHTMVIEGSQAYTARNARGSDSTKYTKEFSEWQKRTGQEPKSLSNYQPSMIGHHSSYTITQENGQPKVNCNIQFIPKQLHVAFQHTGGFANYRSELKSMGVNVEAQ